MKGLQYKISRSGYIIGYGFFWLTVYIFIKAYINPSKQVIVDVNLFGEQYLDIACFIVAIPIITYGLYVMIKEGKAN